MSRSVSQKQVVVADMLVNYYSSIPDTSTRVIVFLHGWRSDGMAWRKIVNDLEVIDTALYSLDLPGFGGSQTPQRPYSVEDYTNVVHTFITKLSLENVVLVGHSFGGRIGIKYAAHPDIYGKLKMLILVDSGGIHEWTLQKRIKTGIAKMLKPLFKMSALKKLRTRIYTAIGSEDYVATPYLKETFVKVIEEDLRLEMKQIQTPTAIIWGTDDVETPLRWAHEMNELILNSKLHTIQNAGHFSFIDKPKEFLEILKDVLK